MACPQHADRAFEQIVIEVRTVLEDILHAITTTPTPNPSPQGGGEYTECAATILRPVEWIKARGLADCLRWPQPA